ncbi:hypothetical protein K7432_003013 [Basidiobolus ranarum]|uniref:Tag1-like fifth Ig-like domain-containing protein n=1 Tax=Basidiobolus ranarum TaxID=34480 RepID=A0ABR2W6X7_9FUNG
MPPSKRSNAKKVKSKLKASKRQPKSPNLTSSVDQNISEQATESGHKDISNDGVIGLNNETNSDKVKESSNESKPDEVRESNNESEPDKVEELNNENEPDKVRESNNEREPHEVKELNNECKPNEVEELNNESEPDKVRELNDEREPHEVKESNNECKPDEVKESNNESEPDEVRESDGERKPYEANELNNEREPNRESSYGSKSDEVRELNSELHEAKESTDEREPYEVKESSNECKPDEVEESNNESKPDEVRELNNESKSSEGNWQDIKEPVINRTLQHDFEGGSHNTVDESTTEIDSHQSSVPANGIFVEDSSNTADIPNQPLTATSCDDSQEVISHRSSTSHNLVPRMHSQESVDDRNNSENTPLLGASEGSREYTSNHYRTPIRDERNVIRDLPKEYAENLKGWWRNIRPLWRWTIIALIILIGQLLLFVLAMRLVKPRTTQDLLQYSKLAFQSATISDLRSSSFLVTTNVSISNLPEYSLVSLPTTLDVLYRDEFMGTIDVPELTLGPHSSWFMIDSPLHIEDLDMVSEFATDLMTLESLIWNLRGNLSLHSNGSKVQTFPFAKDIGLKGLRGIRNLTMTSLNLSTNTGEDDVQLDAVISLVNPSNVTLYPGCIPFEILYNGVMLAQVTTNNIPLTPGPNDISVSGKILTYSEDDTEAVSEFIAHYLKGERTLVDIRGSGTNVTVPWLADAVQSIQASLPVSGWSDRAFITDIKLQDLSSEFLASDPTPVLGGAVQAKVKLPTSFPMKTKYFTQFSEICVYQKTIGEKGDQCIPFARLALLTIPIKSTVKGDSIIISGDFKGVPLFPLTDKNFFNHVVEHFFDGNKSSFGISGETTVYVETAVGVMDIDLREFKQGFSVTGLSGLQNNTPAISSVDIAKKRKELVFESEVTLYNPGHLISSWGTLLFDIVFQGIRVGQVIVPELRMNPGENSVPCIGRLFVTTDEQVNSTVRSLLSNYISASETTLSIVGNEYSTENPTLLETFKNFTSVVSLPGISSNLIANPVFHMMFGSFTTDVLNPLQSVPLKIKYINATVYAEEQLIAAIDADLQNSWWLSPMILPPGKSVRSPKLPLTFNPAGYKRIRESLDRTLVVKIIARVLVEINEVAMWLDYQKERVSVLIDARFLHK